MILHLKDSKNYPKTLRHHEQQQQGHRIKNQLTKIISFSIYQQRTNWEGMYGNYSNYSSLKKIKYLGINLTKDVNDLYKENYKPLSVITDIEKSTQKFIWKHKRQWIAKVILSKKSNAGGYHSAQLQKRLRKTIESGEMSHAHGLVEST
jgi:hypothetical protein